jgi:cytochrome c553
MRVCVLALAGLLTAAATAAADDVPASSVARSLAATCAACHGTDGRSEVPGTPLLAGLDREVILSKLATYREPSSKGQAMHHLASGYTAEQEALIAGYFASLGKVAR